MKVVADFHPPTSVVYSVKCNLTNDGVEHLVVAKTNRLEVYSLHPDGLRLECELEIWGQPIGLRVLPRAVCTLLLRKTSTMAQICPPVIATMQSTTHDRSPKRKLDGTLPTT